MNVKKKARRVMSGLLTAVTVLSTVLSPAVAYASDDAGSVKKIPYYEEIKDQLDEDEVVTAKDYEIKVGDNFDVKSDCRIVSSSPRSAANGANCFALRPTSMGCLLETGLGKYKYG